MKYAISLLGFSGACALTAWGSRASAEEPPAGLMGSKDASSGVENVATAGFEGQSKDDAEAKDATELKLSAGAFASGGNSRSVAGTTLGKLRLRRRENQLSVGVAANYGRAAPGASEPMETTVENYQGKVRYDRFISGNFSLFAAASALRDRFQGLDLRMNLDPGAAYYFVDEPKQQFWGELGYDFQYDIRRRETLRAAEEAGEPALDRTAARHSGRLFAGYINSISPTLTLDAGLEYIQALKDTENFRINGAAALTSAIGDSFSIATGLGVRYDHNPLPGVKTTDYTASLSLVYQLL